MFLAGLESFLLEFFLEKLLNFMEKRNINPKKQRRIKARLAMIKRQRHLQNVAFARQHHHDLDKEKDDGQGMRDAVAAERSRSENAERGEGKFTRKERKKKEEREKSDVNNRKNIHSMRDRLRKEREQKLKDAQKMGISL